jgi:arsenite/tail-anchored protein-transporting ATPase
MTAAEPVHEVQDPIAALDRALRERDLILVTGKGGVGKSTVVAALARLAAARRGQALAVEVSAHPRLGSLVGTDRSVDVRNIQLDDALPHALSRMLRVPRVVAQMLNNRVLRLFVRTSPAVVETVLLDELFELVQRWSQRGVPVVVDLPATGHAMTLLDTPGAVKRMLRVGPVAAKAEQIRALLVDGGRCELVVVALPEELPVNETIELVRRTDEIGVAVGAVIVNQVPRALLHEADRDLIAHLEAHDDPDLRATFGAVVGDLEGVGEAQEQIARLREEIRVPLLEVPRYVHPDPSDRAAALERFLQE